VRAALAGLCLAVGLCPLAGAAGAQTFGSRSHFTEQGGAAIYAAVCAACHMANGEGARGAGAYPSLVRDRDLADVAYPVAMLLVGEKAMPGFARLLSDQQIADVTNYVRTHFGNTYPDRATPAMVATIAGQPAPL
jgi:mono/diheme cytochrome c family protein